MQAKALGTTARLALNQSDMDRGEVLCEQSLSLWQELRDTTGIALSLQRLAVVAWVMQSLAKLQSDGSVRIERALGAPATVYLTIPAQNSGAGKVHVKVQNRLMEYQAITSQHQELPTGANVVVVAVVSPSTLEVAQAN